MPDGYTEADVRLIADAMWRVEWFGDRPAGAREKHAQAALRALSAAGRLLPEGAERSTMFEVAWELVDGSTDGWGAASLADLRSRIARNGPPLGARSGEIKAQEHWFSQWSVVEPVAVKEASDGE